MKAARPTTAEPATVLLAAPVYMAGPVLEVDEEPVEVALAGEVLLLPLLAVPFDILKLAQVSLVAFAVWMTMDLAPKK